MENYELFLTEKTKENLEWRKRYQNRKSKILKIRTENRRKIEEILKNSEKRKKFEKFDLTVPCATSTPKAKNKILKI